MRRLNDHIDKGNLEAETVGMLVIDEYDKCLEMGFQAEMSRLVASLPAVRRKVLLSATRAEEVPAFMRNALKGAPEVVDFLPDDEVVSDRVLINKVRISWMHFALHIQHQQHIFAGFLFSLKNHIFVNNHSTAPRPEYAFRHL